MIIYDLTEEYFIGQKVASNDDCMAHGTIYIYNENNVNIMIVYN